MAAMKQGLATVGKHIFWDCDGTLVDSEALAMPAAIDTLIAYFDDPLTYDPFRREDRIAAGAGMHFGQMFDAWWAEYRDGAPDAAERSNQAAAEQRNVLEALKEVEAIRGVIQALRHTERLGFTNHVVTSSALRRVLLCLETTGLRAFFRNSDGSERIYSATDTLRPSQPKPDPAIYFYALDAAGIGPSDVVAIEDSTSGVRSAVAAGIPVIGYIAGSHITRDLRHHHLTALLEAGARPIIDQPGRLPLAIESALSPSRALS